MVIPSETRRRFAALAAQPDESLNVAEGALLIAAEADPSLDVDLYLGRLDGLAQDARASVHAGVDAASRIARLNQFLFVEKGFLGNRDSYYDPRNSFLNHVLDRRTG